MEAEKVKVVVSQLLAKGVLILLFEAIEAVLQSIHVHIDRKVPIHHRILVERVGLIEVVLVVHKRGSHIIDCERGIWAHQDSNGSGTSSWPRWAFWVDCNVRGEHDSPSACAKAINRNMAYHHRT